ncbi:hypothetical protein BPNPMPFG_002247 [Mesorhizobium sp. AR07]|uniref:hypothetical protein n=1 Tax=Mesorhizobium sp. AR07 TaxID=2865838 RepID=UPI002160D170|nr:hypothetical protein [Mesorhizobium sp. AR07]UVK46577.1 hypothetical protein BPNPMPFG_002247 [Mesorhizobium sp. AR07]
MLVQRLQLLPDNIPITQVECIVGAGLAVEIILQFAPFAEKCTTTLHGLRLHRRRELQGWHGFGLREPPSRALAQWATRLQGGQ